MNKTSTQRKPTTAPEKVVSAGRVFKFSLKGIPLVDAAMEARLEAAARVPRKGRHYPVIIDVPDA